jgi:hypothetical protein
VAGLTWNLVLAALLWGVVGAVALARRGRPAPQALRRLSLQEESS